MKPQNNYLQLDIDQIEATLSCLLSRISERFPHSSLRNICTQLYEMSGKVKERVEWLSKPHNPLRIVGAMVTAAIIVLIYLSVDGATPEKNYKISEFVQLMDSLFNDLIVIGGIIIFFATLENRVKRSRALEHIRELRSLAHIVDMHQLTKDPERLMPNMIMTPSSPRLEMDQYLLGRYLDYCTEMLSLIGKLAAVYAQNIDDAVVLEAVNEIEMLTSNISQKVWLKVLKAGNMP